MMFTGSIKENTIKEHWHGASPNSTFVHIAITNYKGAENVVLLKPVTGKEYNNATKNKNYEWYKQDYKVVLTIHSNTNHKYNGSTK